MVGRTPAVEAHEMIEVRGEEDIQEPHYCIHAVVKVDMGDRYCSNFGVFLFLQIFYRAFGKNRRLLAPCWDPHNLAQRTRVLRAGNNLCFPCSRRRGLGELGGRGP